MKNIKTNSGVTLVEILLAVGFLAMAFIPIMGLLGSSVKVTDKDQSNILAMNLCQEKLNTALQFEFNAFNSWLGNELTDIEISTGTLTLSLKPLTQNGVTYDFKLKVEDREGSFTVASRDFSAESGGEELPVASWKFTKAAKYSYKGLIHRYTMTVQWKDKGKTSDKKAIIKDYTLVTFKAKLK
jgi:hypothetical protein